MHDLVEGLVPFTVRAGFTCRAVSIERGAFLGVCSTTTKVILALDDGGHGIFTAEYGVIGSVAEKGSTGQ